MDAVIKRIVECSHCNYRWATKSKKQYVACPNCLYKIKIEPNEIKE